MAEEEKREEHKEEEKHEAGGRSGIAGSFAKHKTLWIVGGVGAAGVLLLLFMNSGGGSSSSSDTSAAQPSTTDTSTVGAGGAVDTSSLVGTGGYPSWYNPGSAENLDYWPYVPNSSGSSSSSSSGSSKKKSGSGSSSSKSGGSSSSKSGSSSSKSGGGSTSKGSSSGSKSSGSGSKKKSSTSGGVSHGAGQHGVTQPSTKGAAHGHVITNNKTQLLSNLQVKYFPGSNGSNAQGNILQYGNNSKLLKQYEKTGQVYQNKQHAYVIKSGTKLVV